MTLNESNILKREASSGSRFYSLQRSGEIEKRISRNVALELTA